MKKATLILTMLSIFVFIGIGTACANTAGKRLNNQSRRIERGVCSGQLTRQEARTLYEQQRRIRNYKKAVWADGRLTAREAAWLKKKQKWASHRIYRLKHNWRTR
ncbi:MAG: hypothetical protein GY874_01880 [Desulfobacteraceae bacterium]|nr:hypothetical protein [Desulfobacteraceae bacterium]